MAKLKAGVIGLGMGWGHLAGYMEHPDVEVVAVADRIEAKRENAKKEFNLPKVYAEGIDMIRNEKLDILSVAVPNNQHRELTIAGSKPGRTSSAKSRWRWIPPRRRRCSTRPHGSA